MIGQVREEYQKVRWVYQRRRFKIYFDGGGRPNPGVLEVALSPPLASVRETLKFQHGIEISEVPSRD